MNIRIKGKLLLILGVLNILVSPLSISTSLYAEAVATQATQTAVASSIPDNKTYLSASTKKTLQTIIDQKNDVPSTMLSLKLLGEDAESRGLPRLKYELCDLAIGNDLNFCHDNRGIERKDMPQLSGKPVPGSSADELVKSGKVTPVDKEGNCNFNSQFIDWLKEKGYSTTKSEIAAADLKATQSQLIGPKVASIWFYLKANPTAPLFKEAIFISKDNYVLDGHHRWAAILATDFGDNHLGDVKMNVNVIDLDIDALVPLANQFANEFGIQAEGA